MATQDSHLELPLATGGLYVRPPDERTNAGRAADSLPVFDIQSNAPLPALPDKHVPTLDEVASELAAEAAQRRFVSGLGESRWGALLGALAATVPATVEG